MKIQRLLLLLFFTLPQIYLSAQDQSIRLFHIERNENKNIVCYDLLIKNNIIDIKKPIHSYWYDSDGKTEELNFIEKSIAYGVKISSTSTDKTIFIIDAYKKEKITAEYDPKTNNAFAQILINGNSARLDKIFINANPPSYTSVSYIEIFGTDMETGLQVYQKIENK